jgi:hypothetical protein
MATLIDSYSESNASSSGSSYLGTREWNGQSFSNANSANLTSCKFYISKSGSPTGNIYAELYAHTGTYGSTGTPTGSPLATSDAVDVSTLGKFPALQTFTFSGANQYGMVAGTKYVIVLKCGVGDASNYVIVSKDASFPTHGGNRSVSSDGTLWAAGSGQDICFYVYGTGATNFAVSVGAFILTGIAVALNKAWMMYAEKSTGSYNLDGKYVTLAKMKGFTAAVGAFTLTGINITINKAMTMVATCQHYAMFGMDILASKAKSITVSVGEFILTGINVGLNNGKGFSATVADYILTGIGVMFGGTVIWTEDTKPSALSYTNDAEPTSVWTDDTEPSSASYTNDAKPTSSFTNDTKPSSSWTNDSK